LRAECVTRVKRQTGKLNERSRTPTSCSQQQIRMESYFTATAGIRTRDHRDAGAPLLPLDQVPPLHILVLHLSLSLSVQTFRKCSAHRSTHMWVCGQKLNCIQSLKCAKFCLCRRTCTGCPACPLFCSCRTLNALFSCSSVKGCRTNAPCFCGHKIN
jgi:hypothetical protein